MWEGTEKRVVILGAGPAGLTAGYELMRYGVPVIVLEKDPHRVGGISRTERHRGYRFDIGGHRFFSGAFANSMIEWKGGERADERSGGCVLPCGYDR
jgi:protoporphyrinogen oxidase